MITASVTTCLRPFASVLFFPLLGWQQKNPESQSPETVTDPCLRDKVLSHPYGPLSLFSFFSQVLTVGSSFRQRRLHLFPSPFPMLTSFFSHRALGERLRWSRVVTGAVWIFALCVDVMSVPKFGDTQPVICDMRFLCSVAVVAVVGAFGCAFTLGRGGNGRWRRRWVKDTGGRKSGRKKGCILLLPAGITPVRFCLPPRSPPPQENGGSPTQRAERQEKPWPAKSTGSDRGSDTCQRNTFLVCKGRSNSANTPSTQNPTYKVSPSSDLVTLSAKISMKVKKRAFLCLPQHISTKYAPPTK